ncbi:unnamed protein product [Owenia fusiformis]|nr:unnamed protein product [Owenia fusiformis]
MKQYYLGYTQYSGNFRDQDVIKLIGGSGKTRFHDTAALRLSYVLNRIGHEHAIGTKRIKISKHNKDSYRGGNNEQYIFRNVAFGPYLAKKYGNPIILKPHKYNSAKTMWPILGKQGLVRFVTYQKQKPNGHIALWDCDKFYQSPDWTKENRLVSVEFWESPDSHCTVKQDAKKYWWATWRMTMDSTNDANTLENDTTYDTKRQPLFRHFNKYRKTQKHL